MYLKSFYAFWLGLAISASGIVSANAQVDPDLSPLIAPIQPEPRLGLPDQAPNILPVVEPPSVSSPRATTASPAAKSQQQQQMATAPTRPEVAGTWETECAGAGTSASGCQAIIRATMGDQMVLVLAVAGKTGDARFQLALPLGFSLKQPVNIKLGEFEGDFTVSRCTAQGCLIEEIATTELLAALERSTKPGDVVMKNAQGGEIILPLPVAGANKAIAEALSAPSQ